MRWLSETIGPRGSCTPGEQKGAVYAAQQLAGYGFADVEIASFSGAASTYLRYALICAIAAAASGTAIILRAPLGHLMAAVIQIAAIQATFFESDFRSNWSRFLIPNRTSQNVIAHLPATSRSQQAIILVAHLDTARTPTFNASRRGQRAYVLLLHALLLSYFTAALLHTGLALLPELRLTWGWVVTFTLQVSMLALFLSFEQAPFSPGAYDNASGVACVLALARRLSREPLQRSDVWFCLTGCEETGSGGAVDLYDHFAAKWLNPWIINLDQLGYRKIYLRTAEGLLRRYTTTSACISIASKTAASLPDIVLNLRSSQAFSDAAPAYQRGLRAFSFGTTPTEHDLQTHRHRMSDTPEHLSPAALSEILCYVGSLIRALDLREQRFSDE
jgi:hypothetical protein